MEYLVKVVNRLYELHRIKDEYFSYPYPLFGDDVLKFDPDYFKAFATFEIILTRKKIKWTLGDSRGFFDTSWLKPEVVDVEIVGKWIREDIRRKIANIGYEIDCNEIELDKLRQMRNSETLWKKTL